MLGGNRYAACTHACKLKQIIENTAKGCELIPTVLKNTKSEATELEHECMRLADAVEHEKKRVDEMCVSIAEGEECPEAEELLEATKRAEASLRRSYFSLMSVNDSFTARLYDISKSRRKRRIIPRAPANCSVDLSEREGAHFAKGINIYKLLLICFIGSFAGVVLEMLWCLLKHGYLESRAGLVYGPFNMLYGAGAVLLTVSLYGLRNHRRRLSFLGGFVVGSILEYFCSWAQESLLGSRSWDYSSKPFNINGRICLLYSVFWGLLGILWVKNLYPRIAALILKLPNRIGRRLTVACSIFLAVNCLVTCLAVGRWAQRVHGAESGNVFSEFIDNRFPDSRMERIFANMDFD